MSQIQFNCRGGQVTGSSYVCITVILDYFHEVKKVWNSIFPDLAHEHFFLVVHSVRMREPLIETFVDEKPADDMIDAYKSSAQSHRDMLRNSGLFSSIAADEEIFMTDSVKARKRAAAIRVGDYILSLSGKNCFISEAILVILALKLRWLSVAEIPPSRNFVEGYPTWRTFYSECTKRRIISFD